MERAADSPLDGTGPYLWLSKAGPRAGFHSLPPGGMCVSAFLFVERDGKLLLGRYADDPRWESLVGLNEDRWRTHGKGWTVPATHLKYGEPPAEAARRVARDVLGLDDVVPHDAGIESDFYVPKRFPELGGHYDLWLFYHASVSRDVPKPAWYADLAFHDPDALTASDYARGHEDVVARWRSRRGT